MFWPVIELQQRDVCSQDSAETVTQQNNIEVIGLMGG